MNREDKIIQEVKSKKRDIELTIVENNYYYHKWLNSKSKLKDKYDIMNKYLNSQSEEKILSILRVLTPKDIREGRAVLGKGDYGWYCHTIDEIYNINDNWKAYCADDGCRYGLIDSYVLIDEII